MSEKSKSIDIRGIRPLKRDYSNIGRSLYFSIQLTAWLIYYINIYIL
jgi:hypothetical protein